MKFLRCLRDLRRLAHAKRQEPRADAVGPAREGLGARRAHGGAAQEAEGRKHRLLRQPAYAALGGARRSHGPRAVAAPVPHLVGSSPAPARASSVHVRAHAEQDAGARGLANGLRGVERVA